MSKQLVIFGATGTQGSALLEALYQTKSSSKNTIYAVHRKGASASILRNKYPGIKPVQGDMNYSTEIFRVICSAPDVVFFMTPSDCKNEVQLGQNIISAAVNAGTRHIVMSSIDRGFGGNVLSGVDIWDTKHEIEAFLRKQKVSYTIIRPSAYLENFEPGFIAQVYAGVWRDCVDGAKMAVLSTKDLGATVAKVMMAVEGYQNVEINLAGDNLSYEEASHIFAVETRGKKFPTSNKLLTLTLVALMKDLRQMVGFFKEKRTGAEVQHDLMNWGAFISRSGYITGRKL
jgi:uncharacterized protein YbjT (DUF2867 family)